MPKKNAGMTPEEQSEKFREAVRAAIDAGELNPIEADKRFGELLEKSLSSNHNLKPLAR